MFTASYSQISKFLQCPDRWLREPKQPPTPAMQYGDDVHRLRAAILLGQPVESIPIRSGRDAEALALAKAGTLPSRDDLLSVEGSGIPGPFRVKLYGKWMGEMEIAPGYGLRWIEDAAILSADAETRILLDWKTGRPDEEAHALQGACNALPAFTCYPGPRRWIFRPVYLQFPDADYSLEYRPEDVETIRNHLVGVMKGMEAVKLAGIADATVNKYCSSCALKPTCAAFTKAVTVAPQPGAYPMETPAQIVRARDELASIRKCVEAMEDLADEKLRVLCTAGPVIVGGQEWYVKETPTRYEYDAEGVESALVLHKIDPLPYFKPDRTELKKLEKRAPDAFAAVQAHERVKSTSAKLYSRIARGIIDVSEAAPSLAEAAVEVGRSLPPAADAPRPAEVQKSPAPITSIAALPQEASDERTNVNEPIPLHLPGSLVDEAQRRIDRSEFDGVGQRGNWGHELLQATGVTPHSMSADVPEADSLPTEGAPVGITTNPPSGPSGPAAAGTPSDSEGSESGSPGVRASKQADAAPETGALLFPVGAAVIVRGFTGTVEAVLCDGYRRVHFPERNCSDILHVEKDLGRPVQPKNPSEIPFTHPLDTEPDPATVGADLDWPSGSPTCEKVRHIGDGYLHSEDEDGPYDIDGVHYCGRCHLAMDCHPAKEPEAPKPAKKTRNRRPRPTHSCGRKCKWESAGAKTAWCPNCSEVFTPVYRAEPAPEEKAR